MYLILPFSSLSPKLGFVIIDLGIISKLNCFDLPSGNKSVYLDVSFLKTEFV